MLIRAIPVQANGGLLRLWPERTPVVVLPEHRLGGEKRDGRRCTPSGRRLPAEPLGERGPPPLRSHGVASPGASPPSGECEAPVERLCERLRRLTGAVSCSSSSECLFRSCGLALLARWVVHPQPPPGTSRRSVGSMLTPRPGATGRWSGSPTSAPGCPWCRSPSRWSCRLPRAPAERDSLFVLPVDGRRLGILNDAAKASARTGAARALDLDDAADVVRLPQRPRDELDGPGDRADDPRCGRRPAGWRPPAPCSSSSRSAHRACTSGCTTPRTRRAHGWPRWPGVLGLRLVLLPRAHRSPRREAERGQAEPLAERLGADAEHHLEVALAEGPPRCEPPARRRGGGGPSGILRWASKTLPKTPLRRLRGRRTPASARRAERRPRCGQEPSLEEPDERFVPPPRPDP